MDGQLSRIAHLSAAAALLLLLAPSFAAAQAPAGATAVCGDGTYSNTATKRGACARHGGIKTWLADQKVTPAAAKAAAAKAAPARAPTPAAANAAAARVAAARTPAPAAARPANATGQCGDGTYTTAATQRGACGRHGGVKAWFAAVAPIAAPMAKPAPAPAPRPVAPAAKPVPAPRPAAAGAKAVGAGEATALCNDGTRSASQHRSGACARHGGVKQWLKELPK